MCVGGWVTNPGLEAAAALDLEHIMKVYIGLRQMETYERQALKAKVVDWGMY